MPCDQNKKQCAVANKKQPMTKAVLWAKNLIIFLPAQERGKPSPVKHRKKRSSTWALMHIYSKHKPIPREINFLQEVECTQGDTKCATRLYNVL